MMPSQHSNQLGCDPLGQNSRNFRSDAHNLHVGYLPQLCENPIEAIIAQRQRIPSGNKNVPDLSVGPDIIHGFFQAIPGRVQSAMPDNP
jgi:hypothetical protein